MEFQNHTFVAGPLNGKPVVLDLGGNHGEFSASVREAFPAAEIFIVEAQPDLAKSIADRRIGRVMAAAVGKGKGEIRLFLNPTRCSTTVASMKQAGAEEVLVPMVGLAEVVAWTGAAKIDLLKADIEGAELDMLESTADDLLMRIDQFTIEFHDFLDTDQRPRVNSAITRLRNLGFGVVNLSWRTHGDMLFMNPRLGRDSRLGLLPMRVWKYVAGIKRVLGRALGSMR